MVEKYSLKIIYSGKTQQVRIIQSGAGIEGRAVVIQAADGVRLQIVNVVSLVSPAKLLLKRVGGALHLAFPGGDIDAPDLVVQDFFTVTSASLQGSSANGDWMSYDVSTLTATSIAPAAGAEVTAQSVAYKAASVTLGGDAFGAIAENGWFLAGGVAGLAGMAAISGGGGGAGAGGDIPSVDIDTSPLGVIQGFKNATGGPGVTAPTLTTYKLAGVKALASSNDTIASADIDSKTVTAAMGDTWLAALNSAVVQLSGDSSLTVAQLQALVNSYFRILSEADGVVNTTTDVIVNPGTGVSNPTAADYTNIGATVGGAKSVDLLNDFVGLSGKTAVDTVGEINTVAAATYNVMLQAGVSAGTGRMPAAYTLDSEWIAGLTSLGVVGVNTRNISAVKNAIAGHADGTAVDTVQEITALISPVLAVQQLKDYANAIGGPGVTAPTLMTYSDAGIKTFKSLSNTSNLNRKALNDSSTANGEEDNTFLKADILNTALDLLQGNSLTYDANYTGTVQKMVDSYYRILREADGKYEGDGNTYTPTAPANSDVYPGIVSYNDPTLTDYASIGIIVGDAIIATTYVDSTATGNETLNLLNDAIGRLSTASVDTVSEIQLLATTANDVMLLAKGASASQTNDQLIKGLNLLLGLSATTGLTSSNIALMKGAIVATADDGLAVDTASELLGLLGLVRLQSLTDDSAAFGSKSVAAPNLNDWSAVGITANTSFTNSAKVAMNLANYWKTINPVNGLNAINSALDTYTGPELGSFNGTAMSKAVLQDIVDSYGRVLQEADGSRASDVDVSQVSTNSALQNKHVLEQDLINIGVRHSGSNNGITANDTGLYYEKTGELLASSIGSLSSTAVDSVKELDILLGIAENVMKEAAAGTASYTTDGEWVSALTSLGITGVTNANVADIKSKIHDATTLEVDTYDELQAIVSLERVNDYAALNSGYVMPSLSDYQILTLQGSGNHLYTDAKSPYLNAYNDFVNAQTTITSADTIENMVVSYNAILDMADGNRFSTPVNAPTYQDYNNILGTGIVSGTGSGEGTEGYLLNDVLNGLNNSQADTVSELRGLATTVKNLHVLAAGTAGTAPTLTRAELTNLGLNDGNGHTVSDWNSGAGTYYITDSELSNFQNVQVKGHSTSTVDTFAELQRLLSQAIVAA